MQKQKPFRVSFHTRNSDEFGGGIISAAFFNNPMKNSKQVFLGDNYYWDTSTRLPEPVQDTLILAASAIQSWLLNSSDNNLDPLAAFQHKTGRILWEPSNLLWRKAGFHHVEFQTVFIDPQLITVETAVHEIAHILDNTHGVHRMATVFGGGPADEMIRAIGVEPDLFLPRFKARNYEKALRSLNLELNPTPYGRTMGPVEDFAESFRLAVLHPEQLLVEAPKRYDWFAEWRKRLVL